MVLRVSSFWVRVLDHLMVFPPVRSLGMEHHSLVQDQTFLRLPYSRSLEGWSSFTTGSSTWCFAEPEKPVKVDATDALRSQSRLVGPVLGVLPGFLSCQSFCFWAGVSHLNSLSLQYLRVMWVCLSTSAWGTKPLWHVSLVCCPYPRPGWCERLPPPHPPQPTEATWRVFGSFIGPSVGLNSTLASFIESKSVKLEPFALIDAFTASSKLHLMPFWNQTSEVALCPLLPWYCEKLSWNIWFRDY